MSFGLSNAYQLVPESTVTHDRFVFSIPKRDGTRYREKITNQTHLDYICARVQLVLFYYAFWLYSREKLVKVFIGVHIGFLADYFIIFNQPYFYYSVGSWQIPIMYSWVMFFFMIFVMIMQRKKEAHGNI